MANMELLSENLLATTTAVTVSNGSGTVEYLFDRNAELGYISDTYVTGTSYLFSVTLTGQVLSHLLLQTHNLKNFRVFYDGVTANSLAIVTSNSATNYYLNFASTTMNSIHIQVDSINGSDIEIGELIIAERKCQFTYNPPTDNYTPELEKVRVSHEMPDGGITTFEVSDKLKNTIKLRHAPTADYNCLLNIYKDGTPLIYVPFPTTTAWDGVAHEVLWTNKFNFKHSDNAKSTGYDGEIVLEETSHT